MKRAAEVKEKIRFILEGDHYYKTDRPGQNLDRTRTQLKMVKDMEDKWKKTEEILGKYVK